MKNIAAVVTFLGLGVLSCQTLHADSDLLDSQSGIINLIVEAEDGVPAPNASIYISDGHKIVDIIKSDESGLATIVLQRGNYLVSATRTQPVMDALDRFASHTAKVAIMPMDTNSVILTLHPLENPIAALSLSTLRKIGVADEVAKYPN